MSNANVFNEIEARAWENYKKARYLYHLTRVESDGNEHHRKMRSIREDGLVAGELDETSNAIWFFVDPKCAAAVAHGLLMRNYALLRIKKSAVPFDSIHWDAVAESCADVSFYTRCDRIAPEFVKLVDYYRVDSSHKGDFMQ